MDYSLTRRSGNTRSSKSRLEMFTRLDDLVKCKNDKEAKHQFEIDSMERLKTAYYYMVPI